LFVNKRQPLMRYRLRTLLIVLAAGPPILAGAWYAYRDYCQRQAAAMWDEPDFTGGYLPMGTYGNSDDGIMTMIPQR
jgi:hypothetical protein